MVNCGRYPILASHSQSLKVNVTLTALPIVAWWWFNIFLFYADYRTLRVLGARTPQRALIQALSYRFVGGSIQITIRACVLGEILSGKALHR